MVVEVPLGPLWDATDIRLEPLSRSITGKTTSGQHLFTGYHFHNFFDSISLLRKKYATYGHPREGAMELPLEELQTNDVGFMVDCLTGRERNTSKCNQASVADWTQKHSI